MQGEAVRFVLRDGTHESAGTIAHSPFTVGRLPDRDIVLSHPYVSREHATIVQEPEGYYLLDHGSRHGTFVNGQRVTRARLGEKDRIHFGALDGPSLLFGVKPPGSGSTLHEIIGQIPAISASGTGLEKLRWFFESARKLNTYGAVDQILAVLLETTLQLTSVERGYVFLRHPDGRLDLALGRGSAGETLLDDATISRSAIEKATRTASEYIVTDTLSEAAAPSESIVIHNIRTVICIPLRNRRRTPGAPEGEILGVLYLDSRLTIGSLTEVDSDLLRTIATEAAALVDNAQLAVAEENERRYREELNIAAEIQQGLMAVKLPTLDYAAVAARSIPCKQVGGDFYDVVADGQSLSVVVADVSGKGISAAILASTLQGMIYSQLLTSQPLSRIAEVANRYICVKNVHKYATMAILRLYPDGAFEYINCGHVQPLVCSGGHSSPLTASNLPVGLIPETLFASAHGRLSAGSRVVIATDGVTEAENFAGEFFGDERLRNSLHHCATLDLIYEHMKAFCGAVAANDDCTMLEVVYRG
ncbi:MAG TPA: SpoIIE family protein phosphatase [Acidobacteriaceae bacterium]